MFGIWLRSNSKPSSVAHITRWRFGGSSSTWSSLKKLGCHSCTIVESGHQNEQFLFKWTGKVSANDLDVPLCHIKAPIYFWGNISCSEYSLPASCFIKISPCEILPICLFNDIDLNKFGSIYRVDYITCSFLGSGGFPTFKQRHWYRLCDMSFLLVTYQVSILVYIYDV